MISTSSNKIDEIVVPDEIETYVSMPSCLLQGCSNDLIIFRADGGNHFTHYGIYEGMFLIFDVSKDFKDGHLSCYLNNSGDDRPRLSLSCRWLLFFGKNNRPRASGREISERKPFSMLNKWLCYIAEYP